MMPLRKVLVDKENEPLKLQAGKEFRDEATIKSRLLTPRTPLQDVNISRSKKNILKKAQYSQVTPFSTPGSKTPRRRSKIANPAHLVFADSNQGHEGAGGMPWNSLVFKEVVALLDHKQKECDKLLEEKDQVILQLQHGAPLPSDLTDADMVHSKPVGSELKKKPQHGLQDPSGVQLFDGPLDLQVSTNSQTIQKMGLLSECKHTVNVKALPNRKCPFLKDDLFSDDSAMGVSDSLMNKRTPLRAFVGGLNFDDDPGTPSAKSGGKKDCGCSPCPTPTPLPRRPKSLEGEDMGSPPLKTEVCRLNLSAQVSPFGNDKRTVSSATSPLRLPSLDLSESLNITSSSVAAVLTPTDLSGISERNCSVFSRISELDVSLKNTNETDDAPNITVSMSACNSPDNCTKAECSTNSVCQQDSSPGSMVLPMNMKSKVAKHNDIENICVNSCTKVTPAKFFNVGELKLAPKMVCQETWTLPPDVEDASTMVTPGRAICDIQFSHSQLHSEDLNSSKADVMVIAPVSILIEKSTYMTPVRVDSTETMVTPVRSAEFSQMTSPGKVASCETTMTPVALKCSETTKTAVSHIDCSQMTSPFSSNSQETSMTPVTLKSMDTMMTPVKHSECGVTTSPIVTSSKETTMSPLKTEAEETMVTPVKFFSTDTMVTPIKCVHSSQMTSPAHMTSQETTITPVRSVSAPTMVTPVKLVDMGQSMSPVVLKDSETCTSPPREKVHTSTMTLPLCHALPRLSELDLSSLSIHQLATQLETASVSNTLLRQEVIGLKREKEEAYKHIQFSSGPDCKVSAESEVLAGEFHINASVHGQIDDLMTQQAFQLNQIAQLQQKLEHSENKAEKIKLEHEQHCSELQAEHELSLSSLQRENKELQEDLVRAYKQKKQEITAVREECAANDYFPHFERCNKRVQELEEQLKAFDGLSPLLDESLQTQLNLQEVIQHGFEMLKQRSEELCRDHFQLDKQRAKLEQYMAEINICRSDALATNKCLEKEHKATLSELQDAKLEVSQVQELYATMKSELKLATDQVDALTTHLDQLIAELKASKQEIEKVNLALQISQNEVKQRDQQNEALQLDLQDQKSIIQQHKDMYELQVVNLQRTIDTRDREIDSLEQERDRLQAVMSKQKLCNASLEKQLEQKMAVEDQAMFFKDQFQRLQISAKETQDFLEQEQRLLSEELQEAQSAIDATRLELNRTRAEAATFKSECEQLKATTGLFRDQTSELQNELDYTKGQAHFLLLQQGTEMSRSMVSAGRLITGLTALHQNLLAKAQNWTPDTGDAHDSESDVEKCDPSESSSCALETKSFLSSLLNAVEGTNGSPQVSQIDLSSSPPCDMSLCSPVLHCSIALGKSSLEVDEQSAFRRVNGRNSLIVPNAGPLLNVGTKQVTSGESSVNDIGSLPKTLCEDITVEVATGTDGPTLNEQLDQLYTLLGNVTETMVILDKGVTLKLCSAQNEISGFQKELEMQKETFSKYVAEQDCKVADLEKELSKARQNESRQRHDLVALREQLSSQESHFASVKVKLEEVGDWRMGNVQQSTELQRLRQELESRTKEFRTLEADNRLLQEILQSKVQKMRDSGNQDQSKEASYIKENLVLKRECSNLRLKMLTVNEETEVQLAKAKQRMGVYKYNLERAEEEVFKLDDLVERTHQVLKKHVDDIVRWDDGGSLLGELGIKPVVPCGTTSCKSTDV